MRVVGEGAERVPEALGDEHGRALVGVEPDGVPLRRSVGEPTRRSTTTSRTAPLTQVTYLAWLGGTSAKWMPRTVPRRDTEQLAWASSSG